VQLTGLVLMPAKLYTGLIVTYIRVFTTVLNAVICQISIQGKGKAYPGQIGSKN
jgi:hypothetical protein